MNLKQTQIKHLQESINVIEKQVYSLLKQKALSEAMALSYGQRMLEQQLAELKGEA